MSFVFTHYNNKWKDTKIWIRVNKKEFPKSKQPIKLDLVNIDQIDGWWWFKYFISYKKVKLLNYYVLSYLKWVDT